MTVKKAPVEVVETTEAPVEVVETVDIPVETVDKSKSISFKVRDLNSKDGYSIRTFDKDTHGKDFAELAKEFKATNTRFIVE